MHKPNAVVNNEHPLITQHIHLANCQPGDELFIGFLLLSQGSLLRLCTAVYVVGVGSWMITSCLSGIGFSTGGFSIFLYNSLAGNRRRTNSDISLAVNFVSLIGTDEATVETIHLSVYDLWA
jgi:hypothetical protein